MREWIQKYLIITGILLSMVMCRKPYEPPAIKASNHFLAIDGFINTGAFSSTSITLSRSLNLLDSVPNIPELNALVMIQTPNGASFTLADTGNNGTYVSPPLTLDPGQKYMVSVTTSDGNKYLSDPVTPKVSPPIDSLTWELQDDAAAGTEALNIFVNAHDPANNTRYYRWDYEETWQHQSVMETFWGTKDNLIYPLNPDESTFNCWTNGHSNSILLGSTISLSDDVISHAQVANFLKNDPKMDVEYSLLLKQYPLDFDAYKYWLTVQKNSQSLGGLFDIQPSQIRGNFHCITNPQDPVLGYVSACSVQEMRFFLRNSSLPGWKSNPPFDCPIKEIPTDAGNTYLWTYPDPDFQVWYFVSNIPPPATMKITHKDCLDCRLQGGINIKPSFWQ